MKCWIYTQTNNLVVIHNSTTWPQNKSIQTLMNISYMYSDCLPLTTVVLLFFALSKFRGKPTRDHSARSKFRACAGEGNLD